MSYYDMETINYTSCKLWRDFSLVQNPVLKEAQGAWFIAQKGGCGPMLEETLEEGRNLRMESY